ncbi:MAG: hypothetical protein HKN04_10180 [Rhodothermaceae bacterium]|nr:hypothetical protein [Rhodothermaceae bacterium]
MSTGKRYSDAEVHAIFERAAARQEEARRAEDASRAGLSLEELQRIGAEAGIDPAHIAAAATSLPADASASAPSSTFLGMPTALHAERVLPTPVPDETWERIVLELRRMFKKDGISSEVGRIREWTVPSMQGSRDRQVKVTLTPSADGTRVTIDQSMRGAVLGFSISSGIYVLVAAFTGALSVFGPPSELPLGVPVMFLVFAATMFTAMQLWTRTHAKRQRERFERALDRIELITRDAAATASSDSTDTPEADSRSALDLDALPDTPEAARDASSSWRTRS